MRARWEGERGKMWEDVGRARNARTPIEKGDPKWEVLQRRGARGNPTRWLQRLGGLWGHPHIHTCCAVHAFIHPYMHPIQIRDGQRGTHSTDLGRPRIPHSNRGWGFPSQRGRSRRLTATERTASSFLQCFPGDKCNPQTWYGKVFLLGREAFGDGEDHHTAQRESTVP